MAILEGDNCEKGSSWGVCVYQSSSKWSCNRQPRRGFQNLPWRFEIGKNSKKSLFLTIVEDSNSETGNSWQLISTTPKVNNMVKGNDSTEEPWGALRSWHRGSNLAKAAIFDKNWIKWQFWRVIVVKQESCRGLSPSLQLSVTWWRLIIH